MHVLERSLLYLLVLLLGVGFAFKNDYRRVDDIHPLVLSDPVQEKLNYRKEISFQENGYLIRLYPLYNYEISGLIVSKKDHEAFSVQKINNAIPADLCIIWGDNVDKRIYQRKDVKFIQTARFCSYTAGDADAFDPHQVSNNHLVVNNPELKSKIDSLHVGDQVHIMGKLVDMNAELIGEKGPLDEETIDFGTSTNRKDTGAGACEIIYVQKLNVLKRANEAANVIFEWSLRGLKYLGIWLVFRYLFSVAVLFFRRLRKRKPPVSDIMES